MKRDNFGLLKNGNGVVGCQPQEHSTSKFCRDCTESDCVYYPQKAQTVRKPPLGLKPRLICDLSRLHEIRDAIDRYLQDEQTKIPIEWVMEYNELIDRLVSTRQRNAI